MLKLKVGQNYLLIEYNPNNGGDLLDKVVPFMMGCFQGEGKLAMALEADTFSAKVVSDAIKETRAKTVYLLQYIPYKMCKLTHSSAELGEYLSRVSRLIKDYITEIKIYCPDLNIKVINVNAYEQSPEYKASVSVMKALKQDKDSILSVISSLETYKAMSKRYAAIPNEIKIIENDLNKLNKKVDVCDRKDTVESLSYLKLIEKVEKHGSNLKCYINKLPIYTSEKLGEFFSPSYFRDNPYLFKAASYIYQGCNFGMPATVIEIDTSFRLHFIETQDHTFDKMFRRHNWSGVGYPHFGDHGFCAGEFNDTMAHAKEYGLGYYFTCLKQYLTTANVRDLAGFKIWWYPIYNQEGELVYCAGMDAMLDYFKENNKHRYEEIKDLPWPEKAKRLSQYEFDSSGIMKWGCSNMSYSYKGKEDAFLLVCKEKDIDLYNKIMEGMNK